MSSGYSLLYNICEWIPENWNTLLTSKKESMWFWNREQTLLPQAGTSCVPSWKSSSTGCTWPTHSLPLKKAHECSWRTHCLSCNKPFGAAAPSFRGVNQLSLQKAKLLSPSAFSFRRRRSPSGFVVLLSGLFTRIKTMHPFSGVFLFPQGFLRCASFLLRRHVAFVHGRKDYAGKRTVVAFSNAQNSPAMGLEKRPHPHRTRNAMQSKWNLCAWMGVFTLHTSNIKRFAFEFAHAFCVDEA